MSITAITHPLPGERVLALWPGDASAAAAVWLRRPNLFPGRALTAPLLEARQDWAAGRIAQRGQALVPGIVGGLEVDIRIGTAAEGNAAARPEGSPAVSLQIAAGQGLAISGEDVGLARAVEVDFWSLPVVAPPTLFSDTGEIRGPTLRGRRIGPALGELLAAGTARVPAAGILLMQPVWVNRSAVDENDPCDRCPCGEGNVDYEDWRRADGVRLLWYAWPEDWRPLPAPGAMFRNQLAHAVFEGELALHAGETMPWEGFGVPIALVGVDGDFLPRFADRAAVARRGGLARDPRLANAGEGLVRADWRLPGLWQARIEQLAEHLLSLGDDASPAQLAAAFDHAPPCGLLPRQALDLGNLRSTLFPDAFDIDVVPVPLEQLDRVIRESAGAAALDFSRRERVQLLVPVTQSLYDPRLLLTETLDPLFEATLQRFLVDRGRALAARFLLQTKRSVLVHAINGREEPVPAIGEDPAAIEPEDLAGWGPPGGQGGHLVGPAKGQVEFGFKTAAQGFTVAEGDRVYAWVHLPQTGGPRALMLDWYTQSTAHRRAYWGEDAIVLPNNPKSGIVRIGDLPPTGRWVRLEVPESELDLEESTGNRRIMVGLTVLLSEGQAAIAAVGRIDAKGNDHVWFSGSLPKASTYFGRDEARVLAAPDLLAPFEAPLGVVPDPEAPAGGRSLTLEELRTGRALAFLSGRERAQLPALGVDGFISYLRSRADRADDVVDKGFVKVQSDIYRLRQLMLDTADASRLAVSPTLASIARAETATASQKQLGSFLERLKLGAAADTSISTERVQAASSSAGTVKVESLGTSSAVYNVAAGAPASTTTSAFTLAATPLVVQPLATHATLATLNPQIVSSQPIRTTTAVNLAGTSFAPQQSVGTLSLVDVSQPRLATTSTTLLGTTILAAPVIETKTIAGGTFLPKDIALAQPLVGKAFIRTTSIAERLAQPKALEARDYAAASRHEAVLGLVRLAEQFAREDGDSTGSEDYEVPGLFRDVAVYGFDKDVFVIRGEPDADGNAAPAHKPPRGLLSSFFGKARSEFLSGLMAPPEPAQPDEAGLFSDAADMSDYTVALFRQLEGRVRMYRDAIAACETALGLLVDEVRAVDSRIAVWSEHLAEARHDVGVTRALIDEELARLSAINTRRARILAEEVRFIAYRRPRSTDNVDRAPLRTLDPGLLPAPVPECLQAHDDLPDELEAMLRVVREAPAAWFGQGRTMLDGLGRMDLLLRSVQTAQLRSQIAAIRLPPPAPPTLHASAVGKALIGIQARQQVQVQAIHSASALLDIPRLSLSTVAGVRQEAEKVVSLGDLIDGEHGQGGVARRAADFFETFGRICGCLHAGFSAVPPAQRLAWAEHLSQFDAAPSLRNLSALSGFSRLDFIERRRLQGLVDWLFDQLGTDAQAAFDLVNDVVRMCLLLASHAPVGRIIAGRLPRPVLARPGLSIPVLALDARLKIGMQATILRGTQVLARAVVEDIGANESMARVIHTNAPSVELGTDVRVQFTPATLALPALALLR